MPILLGIVGGMSIGVASAFLTAIVADLPFMGWANSLVPPVFFLTAIGSTAVIAWKNA